MCIRAQSQQCYYVIPAAWWRFLLAVITGILVGFGSAALVRTIRVGAGSQRPPPVVGGLFLCIPRRAVPDKDLFRRL
jgi:hypothetical protein